MALEPIRPSDIQSAVSFYRTRIETGTLDPDDLSFLVRLQSDPGALLARIAGMCRDDRGLGRKAATQLKQLSKLIASPPAKESQVVMLTPGRSKP
jgi:hypothetical protein